MANPEWEEFATDYSCELTEVFHVTHVPAARRVIEDQWVKASLIGDESRLNKSRLSVAWVSANDWFNGSYYGTVSFRFPWSIIVKDMHIYWVEVMRYSNPAYRLLLSRKEISSPELTRYDPKTAKGPLKQHPNGKWYWRNDKTSEFMIAENLFLTDCNGFGFVKHHFRTCATHRYRCDERDNQPPVHVTGAKMLAFILGHDKHILDSHFAPVVKNERNHTFNMAYNELRGFLCDGDFGGPLALKSSRKAATLGALALYGTAQAGRADDLLRLLKSQDGLEDALRDIVRNHYGLKRWEPDGF